MTKPALPRLSRIHHLALTVTDVEKSIAWYTRIFGFKRIADYPHEGGFGVILVQSDANLWMVLHHHDANQAEPFTETRTGLDHVGFQVPDRAELESWQTRFAELDVQHSPISYVGEFDVSVLVFRDPDNIQLELFAEHQSASSTYAAV
jgi:catechol 2,3-dioxygenase-like lactoylglutathione lyase family enzyme